MESVILDSSAVIALFNSADHHHGAIVTAMAASSATFSISTMTVTETLVAPARISSRELEAFGSALANSFGEFHPVDTEVAIEAATIRAKTAIATPDAIISATAVLFGLTLWTCDKKLAKVHKGARLIG
jgi:predicted nucleic acid-binding protein